MLILGELMYDSHTSFIKEGMQIIITIQSVIVALFG